MVCYVDQHLAMCAVLLQFGYSIYRTVLGYYSGDENAYDMRKAMSRDKEGKSVIPLTRPIHPHELEHDWLLTESMRHNGECVVAVWHRQTFRLGLGGQGTPCLEGSACHCNSCSLGLAWSDESTVCKNGKAFSWVSCLHCSCSPAVLTGKWFATALTGFIDLLYHDQQNCAHLCPELAQWWITLS